MEVSKQSITAITNQVMAGMAEWQSRPLERGAYAAVFIDAIHLNIRDGQAANRSVYLARSVTVDGMRGIPGLWRASTRRPGRQVLAPRPVGDQNRGDQFDET